VADAVIFVKVPTAKLNVAAVDGRGKPADIRHRGETGGPSRPPKDVEVLASVYDVDVIALGRWGTTRVRLAPGEDRTITVTVPGTAGIDIEASPNPWPCRRSSWHSPQASPRR
jgi:FtsP/CotA-like multicopper oxidase with cupredoxin domain